MEKIRVQSKTLYKIEVNDDGDIITLDPSDLKLYEKAYAMIDAIKDAEYEFNQESKEIDQIEDSENKTRMMVQCMIKYYEKGREAIDIMFGTGASKKIFGDDNFIEMFDLFFEQMEPHFEKIGVNAQEYQKQLAAKYANRKTRRKVLN